MKERGTLVRLWQLWWAHALLDLMWVARDTRSFLLYYASDVLLAVASVTAMLLLAERFRGLGVWSHGQVLFLLGYGLVVRGILELFLSYNVLVMSRRLGRGQLDHLLGQPQPLWMALLTEGFAPFSGSAALLPGIGLLVWAMRGMSLPLSAGWLGLFLVNLGASCALVVSFSFLWGSLSFWAPRAAEEISASAMEMIAKLRPFPLDGIGPALLGGLLAIVPVGFVAWVPCRALLGLSASPWGYAATPAAALVAAGAAAWAFRRGLKHYGRVGSQRYLSFGHRR